MAVRRKNGRLISLTRFADNPKAASKSGGTGKEKHFSMAESY